MKTSITTSQQRLWDRLSGAQRGMVVFLAHNPRIEMRRPGGQPDSGRRAANWDRTVAVLSRMGLIVAYRRYAGGIASAVQLAHPAPFSHMFSED